MLKSSVKIMEFCFCLCIGTESRRSIEQRSRRGSTIESQTVRSKECHFLSFKSYIVAYDTSIKLSCRQKKATHVRLIATFFVICQRLSMVLFVVFVSDIYILESNQYSAINFDPNFSPNVSFLPEA